MQYKFDIIKWRLNLNKNEFLFTNKHFLQFLVRSHIWYIIMRVVSSVIPSNIFQTIIVLSNGKYMSNTFNSRWVELKWEKIKIIKIFNNSDHTYNSWHKFVSRQWLFINQYTSKMSIQNTNNTNFLDINRLLRTVINNNLNLLILFITIKIDKNFLLLIFYL